MNRWLIGKNKPSESRFVSSNESEYHIPIDRIEDFECTLPVTRPSGKLNPNTKSATPFESKRVILNDHKKKKTKKIIENRLRYERGRR